MLLVLTFHSEVVDNETNVLDSKDNQTIWAELGRA